MGQLRHWSNASMPHLGYPWPSWTSLAGIDARIVVPIRPSSNVQRPGHKGTRQRPRCPGDWTTTSDRTSSKVVDLGRLVDDVKQTGRPDRCFCLATDEAHDAGRSSRRLAMNLSTPDVTGPDITGTRSTAGGSLSQ